MKINICSGPNFPVPALQGGGMARAWHGLAHVFNDLGHDISITARSHPKQSSHECVEGISMIRMGGFDQSGSLALNLTKDLFYALSISRKLERADITVINDFWLPALIPYFAPSPGKLVVSVNRMPKGQYSLYGRCDAFVCPNPQVADRLRQQHPELSKKIHIIANPYDNSVFTPGNKKRSGILYVGRIHPEKGLHLLIDALPAVIKELPEINLTVIGSAEATHGGGGTTYGKDLKQRTAHLPVNWQGPEYHPERLRDAYRSHQLFVYPSVSENGETFGIAPIEAMACGCVPITSQLAVFSNFVIHGSNGYLFPHQHSDAADHLAKMIVQSLRNSHSLEKLSAQAIATASQFSMQSVGQQFIDLFHQLHPNQ